jgi:uncharacterized damage-inducible protein DinB
LPRALAFIASAALLTGVPVSAQAPEQGYWLLHQAGGKVPDDTPDIPPDLEKKITAKADVIRWLKNSMEAVRREYPNTDRAKIVRFVGKDTTSEAVFLRLLVHNHEHMGQAIAYARMMGVVPPWSSKSGAE